jgi:tRNA (guanine-N7-)-methyltransferase
MSFGLGHGRTIDPGDGIVGISSAQLGPLPDDLMTNPESGRVNPRAWFVEPDGPFEIEIGSGKGTFLLQQAALEPETNFLGIEWTHEFYAYAADRIRRRREAGKLTNVRMLHADASEFLRWRCPDGIARVIHLYFSDPWPKSRHHKKRVIQHGLLAQVWRVLAPGGELRIVTDHDDLWAWDLAHFKHWASGVDAFEAGTLPAIPDMPADVAAALTNMPDPAFEMLGFDRPESAGKDEIVGTNFERKFRREGRGFHACVLRRLG